MTKRTFKTNINCNGCLANVTPYLNETVGENQWDVDLKSPDRILTIHNESVDTGTIRATIEKAGYTAQEH